MASCIRINPEEEIVLIWCDFYGTVQIAALKSGLEYELFLKVKGGVHALKSSVVELISVKLVV